MWKANPLEYVAALVYSVTKEIASKNCFIDHRGEEAGFAGLVGSFAFALASYRRERKDRHGVLAQRTSDLFHAFGDVDVLFFVPEITSQKVELIREMAHVVCRRYEVPETTRFEPLFEMSPAKHGTVVGEPSTISVQFIINDAELIRSLPPSRLVIYDRLKNHISMLPKVNLHEYYGTVDSISLEDLLSEPLGLNDLKDQLVKGRTRVRYWSTDDERMRERGVALGGEEVRNLGKYAARWSLVNFCRATHVPLVGWAGRPSIQELVACIEHARNLAGIDPNLLAEGDTDHTILLLDRLIELAMG